MYTQKTSAKFSYRIISFELCYVLNLSLLFTTIVNSFAIVRNVYIKPIYERIFNLSKNNACEIFTKTNL